MVFSTIDTNYQNLIQKMYLLYSCYNVRNHIIFLILNKNKRTLHVYAGVGFCAHSFISYYSSLMTQPKLRHHNQNKENLATNNQL